ncbi:hypothetical protein PYCC9005_005408 [Savitreella phatthalungensis]
MEDELERFRSNWRRDLQRQNQAPSSGRHEQDLQTPSMGPPAPTDASVRRNDSSNAVVRRRTPSPTVTRGTQASLSGTAAESRRRPSPRPRRSSRTRSQDSHLSSDDADDESEDGERARQPVRSRHGSASSTHVETKPRDVSNGVPADASPEDKLRNMSALELYERGVLRERQGALSDALTHYRLAFKKDASVDRLFREAYRAGKTADNAGDGTPTSRALALEDTGYAKFVQTTPDYDAGKRPHKMTPELDAMIAMMSQLRMPVEVQAGVDEGGEAEESTEKTATIANLPEEVLHRIARYVLLSTAGAGYTSLSMTCQKLFLVTRDPLIWRELCVDTYWWQVYSDNGRRLDEGNQDALAAYVQDLEQECKVHYYDDWQRMFCDKPRVRYDGIYIATCHYTRPGTRDNSLSWSSPIHLITYFRYIRFYSDGAVLTLLTTAEPKDVVHDVDLGSKVKGIQRGTWQMDRAGGTISIDTRGPQDYLFFITLQVKSSSRGRQNKLAWRRFLGVHPHSGQETEFNLKHDKSYYFSKVRSYTAAAQANAKAAVLAATGPVDEEKVSQPTPAGADHTRQVQQQRRRADGRVRA